MTAADLLVLLPTPAELAELSEPAPTCADCHDVIVDEPGDRCRACHDERCGDADERHDAARGDM